MKGRMRQLIVAVLVLLGLTGSHAVVRLRPLDTIYTPKSYDPLVFEYNVDAAEQFAYDPNQPITYIVGNDNIHIIDQSDPSNLQNIGHVSLGLNGEFTDIEACNNWVAAGFDNDDSPLEGKVYIYRSYDPDTEEMQLLHEATVGALPDMVLWTQDCRTVLVAVEGELRVIDGQVVDPEGAVAFIRFQNDPEDEEPTIQITDFTKFNEMEDDYVQRGVRRIYRGENSGITTTFSQDLEPEYLAFNQDDSIAYVVLQENNAMATVDVATGDITELYPLGLANFASTELDPSDRDDAIKIAPWMVYGIKQPDGFKYLTVDGTSYIITANEGDEKDYEIGDFEWAESQRGNAFSDDDLIDGSVDPILEAALGDNEELGRLTLSLVDGELPNGKYDTFLSYGGRGFSIYNPNDFSLVYNSGSELEREIERDFSAVFNSNPNSEDDTPEQTFDTRSDNRGPEPEAIEYGTLNGQTLVFIGLERPGFVAIYTLDQEFPGDLTLQFQSIHYAGGTGATWRELWEQRVARDLDPEDLKFIPQEGSPTGVPLLGVSGSYSGTYSVYEVYDDGQPIADHKDSAAGTVIMRPFWAIVLCLLAIGLAGR